MNIEITTILFDLDGTLLLMDNQKFAKLYFGGLEKKINKVLNLGENFINIMWASTKKMVKNDGSMTNEDVFWKSFTELSSFSKKSIEDLFLDYYENEFINVKLATTTVPLVSEIISTLKEKGYRLVIATNPMFPRVCTAQRIAWAGLNIDDSEIVTTYENSHYCKPNIEYYKEILARLNVKEENAMMIGNDVKEDMVAGTIGLETYLVTNNILHHEGVDISQIRQGTLEDLSVFVKTL